MPATYLATSFRHKLQENLHRVTLASEDKSLEIVLKIPLFIAVDC